MYSKQVLKSEVQDINKQFWEKQMYLHKVTQLNNIYLFCFFGGGG